MSARGQTTLDFAVGVSVFLLTVGFVFLFVPSVFAPFEVVQGTPVTADRAATHLVDGLLAGESPGALAPACTVGFFADAPRPGCPYSPGPVSDALGLGDGSARVTVENGTGVVSYANTTLARGPADVPAEGTVAVRTALLDGERYTVRVVVW
ncbi:DUF7287 family protein [Halosegnis marinus]|uniref:Uncharacterized protein n=2 Tax=Halosegnis marinus TaxID=3034023 RepID=A0ABD5ZLS9_9EURY|nr:hypothetical protein [Halosegnis sp. DT85]